MRVNHYKWMDKHLPAFFEKLGLDFKGQYAGIVSAHGDKCYCNCAGWEKEVV